MKARAQGTVHPNVTVIGRPVCPAYLVRGEKATMMIEAGVNFMGPIFLENIREHTAGSGGIQFLFVTHSHWDHLGAMPFLKRSLPEIQVGAHRSTGPLLGKESAIRTMEFFSEAARIMFEKELSGHLAPEMTECADIKIAPVPIAYELEGGEEIDLGGVTCRVIATPGHTRDHLSYHFPEIGALFPGEAIGVPEGMNDGAIQVEFLSSYDDYLASIETLIPLRPAIIGMGHDWVFTGDDALEYMEQTLEETKRYRALIERYLDDCHGDIEKTIARMVEKEFDERGTSSQERNAYIANLSAQVRLIASSGRVR